MSTYRIKHGDNLWKLARKWKVDLQALLDANPQIEDPDMIIAGEELNRPDAAPVPHQRPASLSAAPEPTLDTLPPPPIPELSAADAGPQMQGGMLGRVAGASALQPNMLGRSNAPSREQPDMAGRVSPPSRDVPQMLGRVAAPTLAQPNMLGRRIEVQDPAKPDYSSLAFTPSTEPPIGYADTIEQNSGSPGSANYDPFSQLTDEQKRGIQSGGWIKGRNSGKRYEVGKIYKNAKGSFELQPDGSFKKVA